MIDLYNDILHDFQQGAVNVLYPMDKHMIGLDMGLGKTYTGLSILQKRFKDMPVPKALIVCQKTKVKDWVEDVEKFFPGIPIIRLDKGTKKKQEKQLLEASGPLIVISAYKTAQNRFEALKVAFAEDIDLAVTLPWDFEFIVDESQVMKSRKSAIGKWGLEVSQQIKYVSLLSGDPISNTYEDLYQQMRIMGMEMEWDEWNNKFCITEIENFGTKMWPKIVGFKDTDLLLEALHSQGVFIKAKDVVDLPEQTFITIKLDGNTRAYKALRKHRVINDYEFATAGALHTACRQLASGFLKDVSHISNHKLDAVEDLLDSTNDGFIIFYNYVQECKDLHELLNKKKIKAFEINGQQNQQAEAQAFEGRKVLLIQYQAGSAGLNLQDFNKTIYYSPTTSAGNYKQSLARTHRIGQTKPVFYYRLQTTNTTEGKTFEANQLGIDYSNEMFMHDIAEINKEKKNGK